MPIDAAEHLYTAIQVAVFAAIIGFVCWYQMQFWSRALIDRPESLSAARLRRTLIWGKILLKIFREGVRSDSIKSRMSLALQELRRRG